MDPDRTQCLGHCAWEIYSPTGTELRVYLVPSTHSTALTPQARQVGKGTYCIYISPSLFVTCIACCLFTDSTDCQPPSPRPLAPSRLFKLQVSDYFSTLFLTLVSMYNRIPLY